MLGLGRGDSAVRMVGLEPARWRPFEESIRLIRELANGRPARLRDTEIHFPWAQGRPEIPVYVAAYGPKALAVAGRVGDGVVDPARRPGARRLADGLCPPGRRGGRPRPGRARMHRLRAGGRHGRPARGARRDPVLPGDGLEPRARPAAALRPLELPPELWEFVAAPRGVRLPRARPNGAPRTASSSTTRRATASACSGRWTLRSSGCARSRRPAPRR